MAESVASLAPERQFPCTRCGARLEFAPGTNSLVCPYCGTKNAIAASSTPVPLLDFLAYANQADGGQVQEQLVVKCTNCAAETHLAQNVTSGRCAFCGAPIVAQAQSKKLIKPGGLLPFAVNKGQANELFRKWISGLWFAPGDLVKRAEQAGIDGAYVPCWTYDSESQTAYTGMRGDDYTTTETYTEYVNGQAETRTRTVTRTRWTPVSGSVPNAFHDVMVLATNSLPPKHAAHLEPWDLAHLVPYADEYLSGMTCQSYQIDLSKGFEAAREKMMAVIRQTIERDIGGDHQQITTVDARYFDVRFRHLLLPLWISAYHYNGNTYRFLVNARTGSVRGERPVSTAKIAALIGVIVAIAIVLMLIFGHGH